MGIQLNGNNDNISAVDGDLSITGIVTFSQLDVGNNIKFGNAGVVTATSYRGDGSQLTGISAGVSLANGADNRVVTATGAAALNAEANLTYDGTTLNIIDSAGGSGSHRLTIGNSHDLRLYHDGNSTIGHYGDGDLYLTSENGKDLYLRAADDIFIKPQGGENGIIVTGNGAVELYNDNSKRFYTRSNGVTVQGNSSGAGIDFSTDTTHRGTVFFDNANKFHLYDSQTHDMITGVKDGAVELYHDNVKRFETINGGVKVTNNLELSGTTSSVKWPEIGNSNSRTWEIIGEQGSYGILDVKYASAFNGSVDEVSARFRANGAVDLYHNNSKKFETTANGIKVNNRIEVIANAIVDTTAPNGNDVGILFASAAILPATGTGSLTDASKDLGSTSYRWRNIYTNDLNLSNKGSTNSVDNTWGDYTIQEGESDLFLINNRSGKKYKFNLTEVL